MSRPGGGLVDLLSEQGVGEKGARLYLAACRAGPVTAAELARLSAIHRVEAYRLLKELTGQGLLRPNGGRPQRFTALPPDELLERWIQSTSEKLRRLERDRPRLLSDWEAERLEAVDHDIRRFAVLDGIEPIRRFVRSRIGTATKEVLLTAAGASLAGLIDSGFDRALREAVGRGVKVRLLTEVEPSNLGESKLFAGFLEVRHSPAPVYSRTAVVDGAGALVFVSGERSPEESPDPPVAVWSTAPAFVQIARQRHRRLWATAQRVEERFVEIEDPPTATLPVVQGKESAPFQRLREIASLGMKASGVRAFRLELPELIGTIARQLGREIASQVEGSTSAEVVASLSEYYSRHTMGRLTTVRDRPLTMRVSGCFACTSGSPEIGREMCPQMLRAVLEAKLGKRWVVTKPDPTKHASRGCQFVATPG